MNGTSQWGALADYFLNMVSHPRYGLHAGEMFKLVLVLREEPDLANITAQADYLYITLKREGLRGSLVICNEEPGYFTICVRYGQGKYKDDNNVALEYVPALLIYHLERLGEAVPQV